MDFPWFFFVGFTRGRWRCVCDDWKSSFAFRFRMKNVFEHYIYLNEIVILKVRENDDFSHSMELTFELGWKSDDMFRKGEIRLTDIARLLGSDWPALAAELELTEDEVTKIMDEFGENAALHMLRYWLKSRGPDATGML